MSWQPPPPPPTTPKESTPAKLNYYQLLQVDPAALPTVIRYAYRYLAAMYHPDNMESADIDKFKLITEAWRILSDSNKRNAYDIQLGVSKHPAGTTQASTGSGRKNMSDPKPSVSWSEVDLRLAVLQVLFEARRKKPQSGGASAKILMDCLGVDITEMEYVLWYLREKGYVERQESQFIITIDGVDYLIDQLSKTQPLNPGNPLAGMGLLP